MALYTHVHVCISEIASGLIDTNNHGVLLFAWVLLHVFRSLVVTILTSTIWVLLISGYLYSRVYGMRT